MKLVEEGRGADDQVEDSGIGVDLAAAFYLFLFLFLCYFILLSYCEGGGWWEEIGKEV